MEDYHVDRPGVEARRRVKLTGTNNPIGLIVSQQNSFDFRIRQCLLAHIFLIDLVVMSEVPHPIPFRTRSLSPPEPMVLRLKARESRSPPGLSDRYECFSRTSSFTNHPSAAGWSSPVARQAHNLKVAGSNPAPAPKSQTPPITGRRFCVQNTDQRALLPQWALPPNGYEGATRILASRP